MSTAATYGLEALQPAQFDSWEPRRALTLSAARRRTAFVRALRLVFIAAAALVVASVLVQLALSVTGSADAPVEAGQGEIRMTNPRFTGHDENRTPFALTADTAVRRASSPDSVAELERPRLQYDFLNPDSDASNVLADRGAFDPANRILELWDNVNFETSSGYRFETTHARVFLREERVEGDEPVAGAGPMGNIRADRYEIREAGNHIIFDGRVRATIIQDRTAGTVPGEAN